VRAMTAAEDRTNADMIVAVSEGGAVEGEVVAESCNQFFEENYSCLIIEWFSGKWNCREEMSKITKTFFYLQK
jgi:hypothetical protein